MRKIVSLSVSSGVVFLIGLYLIISQFTTLSTKSNPVPIIVGFVLLLLSLILLLVTLKSLMGYVAMKSKNEEAVETVVVGSTNLIERNNEIASDWDKTNEARDKLKLLKMSAAAEEQQ